jgi:basic membrane lipoprotein Med (substrate-binding protein (PBP1-ABC) superfamily)
MATSRNKKGLAGIALVAVVALIAGTAASSKTSPAATQQTPTLIVGGIHVGSIRDAGYNQAQHDGLMYLKAHVPGVKVIEAENIPEGPDVERVMETMIAKGAKLIFPQSFGYQDFALKVAAKHRDVIFEHPAGYKSAPNFGTYWAASTPINYALGAAAAKTTKTGKLGFIGAMPIPTVIATANAFHLGARSVNPRITTTVIFNGTWSDAGKEAAATRTLAAKGVDVIASLVDSPLTITKTAEQRHVFSIGYHSGAAIEFAPKYWLSAVDFNWGPMFVQTARSVINGTWKPQNKMAPVTAGIARLAPFGKNVPAAAKTAATTTVAKFKSGKLKSPFTGPVYDQSGKLRVAKGKVPPPGFEFGITWLAQGMIGKTK